MSEYFIGNRMNDIYIDIYNSYNKTNEQIVSSRVGDTNEKLHALLSLSNPRERWTTVRVPAISPAYSFAELICLMNGSDDADLINSWNPALSKFQGSYSNYPGAYGYRLRNAFGFDQLNYTYDALLNNPNSRQVLLDIWKPDIDFPIHQGKPNNDDIPCNIVSLLKIRKGKLYWTQIMRSNDVYLGLPYDVLLFTSLQEVVAGWLQLELGEYTHFCDSLHYYINDKIAIEKDNKILVNTDDLRLEKKASDEVFNELFVRIKELSQSEQIDICVNNILNLTSVPKPYENMLMILCMYMINKKSKNMDLFIECSDRCTNELYTKLFNRWKNKK